MGYETTDDKHPDPPLVNGTSSPIFQPLPEPLMYGRKTHPDNLRAVWGARLIWPDQLVHDRQDLVAVDDESREALMHWLNNGGIANALQKLRTPYTLGLKATTDNEVVIYEDESGKIIGSAQSSHGYVYVAGWLKEHEVQ